MTGRGCQSRQKRAAERKAPAPNIPPVSQPETLNREQQHADRADGVRLAQLRLALRSEAVARLAIMAYDDELADRIRFLVGAGPGVTEKRMFGGQAFLVGGNLAISASGRGGALVRVDPAESAALCEATAATVAVMSGREMRGWLRISSDDLDADDQLSEWVSRAVRYAQSLPPRR